ncbi:DDE-type integrase/transposase/recombinase [Paenibacillus filicis]|uniref:DDE-type integrase/transposase/recombinase n=1 Tax=Paenibacillus gyeongsangnamensis TaxID=3388067 RepID=A0ABT4Q4B6_9BACL|nr:DDE-type integrase/transposase/recombinase [Paenibacillus filicis]MCZ8511627.1 DDE-type integrase/transposase/recombinase [Paenibacillus filicis]
MFATSHFQVQSMEQDHRFIKKITNPMHGFKSFLTADKTLKVEYMHRIRKGQTNTIIRLSFQRSD